MAQVIQCPTCAKKFKLPDRPPATFTCTGCQTVMDLSAFRAAAGAAPEPAPAPSTSQGGGAGAGRGAGGTAGERAAARRAARAGAAAGAAAGSSTRTSSARRARARDDDADGAEGGRDGLAPPKDNSKALIFGSLGAFVVIGVVAFLLLNKDKPAPPETPGTSGTKTAEAPLLPIQPPPPSAMTESPPATSTDPAGTTPTPAPSTPEPEKPSGPPKAGAVKEVGHHPDTSEDERKNIDRLIDLAVFQNAGRDSKDAERQLVQMGIKAAPRLVNVFNTVKLQEGFENRLGKMKAGIADRALRSIDGYVDRASRGKVTLVTAASDPKFVETIAKRWSGWWENGYYKEPKKPWDERTEGNRGEKADPTDRDNPGTTDGDK
jgi:hypothetical protein